MEWGWSQIDYVSAEGGSVKFEEPGSDATEEIEVKFEDIRLHASSAIQISQKSMMWEGDSCALIRYIFQNTGVSKLTNLYMAQYMDFDVMGWRNEVTWETAGNLGFACIGNPEYTNGPFIGMAMFDTTDSHVNTGAEFPRPGQFINMTEADMGNQIRSGSMETATDDSRDRSIVLSYGPVALDVNESKSPVILVLSASSSKAGLRQAMEDAHDRLLNLYGISSDVTASKNIDTMLPFCKWYPNPFNASTTIRFKLAQAGQIRLEIIDLLGRRIETLADSQYAAGEHSVQWHAEGISAGLYIVRLQTSEQQLMSKLILQR